MTPTTARLIAALGGPADGPTDAELLAWFAARRDQAAFELLVWRHAGMVLRVCRSAPPRPPLRRGCLPGHVPRPGAAGRVGERGERRRVALPGRPAGVGPSARRGARPRPRPPTSTPCPRRSRPSRTPTATAPSTTNSPACPGSTTTRSCCASSRGSPTPRPPAGWPSRSGRLPAACPVRRRFSARDWPAAGWRWPPLRRSCRRRSPGARPAPRRRSPAGRP